MEHISYLDCRARTTRDGHAASDLRKAVTEIADALGDPSKQHRSRMSPLAAILVENMADGNNDDILRAARLI